MRSGYPALEQAAQVTARFREFQFGFAGGNLRLQPSDRVADRRIQVVNRRQFIVHLRLEAGCQCSLGQSNQRGGDPQPTSPRGALRGKRSLELQPFHVLPQNSDRPGL